MDIDISKENIQPLRGGRNLMQLGTALQAQSDTDAQRQLQLQKEEHEAAINNYEGPDPLDPWFNYIQWVEQCYPKHGHEGHMDKIIKDCLQQFEKDERYYQDRRLVKLWIKYIDCLSNPLEIYQRLYNSGIGVQCSELYRAWACYCEESGDYKKANQVYVLGMQARAQPIDELEQAHMNFQLFFAQRMLHDDSPTKRKAASALAETRMALTSLKSFKRRNIAAAPVQRVGDSVKSITPGMVRQGQSTARSNVMLTVYEDAPPTSVAAIPAAEDPGASSLVASCSNVENQREIGVWTHPHTKMVHSNVVPHQPLPFTPYEDEDDVLRLSSKHLPHCVDDLIFTVPLCVPDPPDDTKMSCYNKAEVYVTDKEYSLEEIRSRKYNVEKKPIKTENENQSNLNYGENINETLAQCSALETLANCALEPDQDHLGQLMPLAMPALQSISKVTNMHSPGEPKVLQNLDSKEFSELSANKKTDDSQKANKSDKENQNAAAVNTSYVNENCPPPAYAKNNLLEEFNRSLIGNLMSDSVTVNTKEARWELRNIFNDNEPSMVQPVVQQFDVQQFDIHEDKSITMAINAKRKPELPAANVTDKENANHVSAVNNPPQAIPANKTAYFDEPSCTQVFNFYIKDASTPNMSQFKKPAEHKLPAVPKFNIDESGIEQSEQVKLEDTRQTPHQHSNATNDHQGAGLSVIMEATREYNSKSGSSSSGQSTRTNFTGYTTNYDSMYNHEMATSSKRVSISQPRLANGQFARAQKDKPLPQPTYPSHDHQYQKPGYNAYAASPRQNYQNFSYQYNNINNQVPQGYASPQYHSPQHSQHPVQPPNMSPTAPGFSSPTYNQMYSPGHHMSPQPYRQEFQYPERQHVYANHPQFQSPPHQTQYQNQYYPRQQYNQQYQMYNNSMYAQNQAQAQSQHLANQSQANQSQHLNQSQTNQNQHLNQSQANQSQHLNQSQANQSQHLNQSQANQSQHLNQSQANQSQHLNQSQANQSQHLANQSQANQSYASPYRQVPKVENGVAYGMQNQPFQVYQSPLQTSMRAQNEHQNEVHMRPANKPQQAEVKMSPQMKPQVQKNTSTSLRNIRHEQPKQYPDVGFSNQFINFISNRNEPKDNANTPKFNNSPNISQKMHKNLYVSSPEQAQIPPSSGMSDSDSKDGMTAQTLTPIQSANVTQIDKNKDISKRQLDFEQRAELQSEDSRDSVGKDSRISSVYSRQSDFQSDGYGMDVDSENSMECGAFKSTHSISLIETSDIPRPADIDFPKQIDPFNRKMLASLLEYVKFPNKTHADGYVEVRSVPKVQLSSVISIGNNRFSVEKQLGKGNYGAVFLCLDLHTNRPVAVKYQKPSRPWEFYVCQEIKARIKDPFMLPGYMDITTAFIGENASLFVSEYSKYGSLLDVANKVRMATSKCINEAIVILLASEMLSIVHYLHKAQIIHADIKPDNFLLMQIPAQEWRTPSLQLIDLGCAIDMSLYPEHTAFRELIATEGFTCTEMREGKPWTYQTDLYCLAGTIHVILMGSYMKVASRLGQWNIDKKLPRYIKSSLWDKIFTTLLNVPDCNNLPDLLELKSEVDNVLSQLDLGSQLRSFDNVLKSR